ncbi:MAG: beta-propeller fold lactonase family protein [Acidobacteria bacterium]|nr:beta-propeller fold lactonase family protein [Acidobacteriota bacterium]
MSIRSFARKGTASAIGLFCALLCAVSVPTFGQETHKLLTTIKLDSVPASCSVSPDNHKLVITTADDQVLFYDLRQARITSRLRVDGSPLFIHRLPGGKFAMVGHWNGRKISLVDLYGGRFVRNVPTADGPTFFGQYNRVILLLQTRAAKLSFLNEYTFRPAKDVVFDAEATGLAVAPGRGRAYVAVGMQKIGVVDVIARELSHSFNVLTAKNTPLAIDLNERWLFALGPRNTVLRISLDEEKESKRISTGSGSTALKMSDDGKYLYVSNGLEGRVSILDAESFTELEQVSVGTRPSCLDVSRDNRYVFVCNRGPKTISILQRVR